MTNPGVPFYHKGLPHDGFGEVDPTVFSAFVTAFQTRSPQLIDQIPLGHGPFSRRLTSPHAGLCDDLLLPNPQGLTMPAPPTYDSAEAAGEMVELYWMSLLRDVPFTRMEQEALAYTAADDISRLSSFEGPKAVPQLFRGTFHGDHIGPYISQFLLLDAPYGPELISQRIKTVMPGRDYMTEYPYWLAIQNGAEGAFPDLFDPTPRYIRNMRDLGQYVHVDALYQAYLNACFILNGMNTPKAKLDAGNPYTLLKNATGFAVFGGPHILSLVCEVATRALKAVWFQKWCVHRRLRPEAYAGLVHLKLTKARPHYPLHEDVLQSQAAQFVHAHNGFESYLLPMAFPEGSPTHPAYGAGHATVAGACVTILKAYFDECQKLPHPVVPDDDGKALVAYTGPGHDQLTVGGELNKLAANVAIGRNMAGVHWRSDYTESVRLGERVALCILKRQSLDYKNAFVTPPSFTLTTFDGKEITIKDGTIKEGAMPYEEVCAPPVEQAN